MPGRMSYAPAALAHGVVGCHYLTRIGRIASSFLARPDPPNGTPALAACCARVPRYFFDTRDNDTFVEDDEGLEFDSLEAAKIQAAKCLADLARDVLPGSLKRMLAVEVRDERQPVLRAMLTFEAVLLID